MQFNGQGINGPDINEALRVAADSVDVVDSSIAA